jgi:hypothetical protein
VSFKVQTGPFSTRQESKPAWRAQAVVNSTPEGWWIPSRSSDSDFSAPLIIGPDMEAVRTVTQMLVDNALVVRVGPFPTDDSGVNEQARPFILTLAVSPEDATALT